MKKFALVLMVSLFGAAPAHALLTPLSEGYFQDQSTGYAWKKLNTFFGMSYNQMMSNLDGFNVANDSELKQMHLAAADMDFDSLFNTIGGRQYQDGNETNEIIMGVYESTLGPDYFATANQTRLGGTLTNDSWAYRQDHALNPDFDANRTVDNFGVWALSKDFAQVHNPEPATMLMMMGGLAGAWRMRRKKA